jgi:hypothetical protein
MGRNMSEELDRMQDQAGEVRARMWATLAAQSDDAFERLTAHQRAIEAQEEVPWLQVKTCSALLPGCSSRYLFYSS